HTSSKRDWSSDVCSSDLLISLERACVPPKPELAFRPALLLTVVFPPRLGVTLEFLEHVTAVSVQAGVVVPCEQIADGIGGENPRSEERRVGKGWRQRWRG